MLLALRFEPSMFFLKGKVESEHYNIHKHTSKKKSVRCEMTTKAQSDTGPNKGRLSVNRGTRSFWLEQEI